MKYNQDLNGSNDKPFPQIGNFVVDAEMASLGEGRIVTPSTDHGNVANHFGQVKYARREGAVSIYKDETRNTANDNAASKKAESSCAGDETEESQGI